MTLMDKPGVDQVTLASCVALDAATSGSVIGRLEARGWLRRESDARDRRRKLLWITPAGEAVGRRMAQVAPRVQERLLTPLQPHECAQLVSLLSKLETGQDARDAAL
jgi:DNA-binding MarR family transcriptional regulator